MESGLSQSHPNSFQIHNPAHRGVVNAKVLGYMEHRLLTAGKCLLDGGVSVDGVVGFLLGD